jgi:HTH-type transcriptional regulator/antitoxin HigA
MQADLGFRNSVRIGRSTVSTGATGHSTPTGVFTILEKNITHDRHAWGILQVDLLKMATPKSIHTDADYKTALAEIERLIDSDPGEGSEEANKLEVLAVLVQDYESKRFPLGSCDPVEAIEFRMEQQDLAPRDLIPYIGSRSKVSEVLARKRPLTLAMIRALHEGLGIPASVLIQETGPADQSEKPDWNIQ